VIGLHIEYRRHRLSEFKVLSKIIRPDSSGPLSSNSPGQLHVLGHDGDSLGMDSAQVGVLEKSDKVGFGSFLEGQDGVGLEPEVGLEFSRDFPDQSLEGELSDEQVGLYKYSVTIRLTTNFGWGNKILRFSRTS
jgi:hypothetical protein